METQESLRKKIDSAKDIKSVVRTMKAMSASNIGQYEKAVDSLGDYYQSIALGMVAYFSKEKTRLTNKKNNPKIHEGKTILAIVFGSDQGLVGQFNDSLSDFVAQSLRALKGKKEIWAIGERVKRRLSGAEFSITELFPVPNSVEAITPLVGEILSKIQEDYEKENENEFYIFHNQPNAKASYDPNIHRLLPLDKKWKYKFDELQWPTNKLPEVSGGMEVTLRALIREYLFVSLFKACAESLASENSSRLSAMQRAEKNIEELQYNLSRKFHSLRQSSIDEELFDVVSGFEAARINR